MKLPQLSNKLFVTDAGIETVLIFKKGLDLPNFSAFHLLKDEAGRRALLDYFRLYARIAREYGTGLVLESPTWRSNPDWGAKLGYSASALDEANRRAVELLQSVIREPANREVLSVISGCIGPRDDGYNPTSWMKADQAAAYHAAQVKAFRAAGAQVVTAITMTYPEEAIGIVQAAQSAGLPSVIAFTVETDGKLPDGKSLKEAIAQVDKATGSGPAYYMVNCAHPTHFEGVLAAEEPWVKRIRGLRANASRKSHAELNESTSLDDGNPAEFGAQYGGLVRRLPQLNVLGGCCGTDERHIEAICKACVDKEPSQK